MIRFILFLSILLAAGTAGTDGRAQAPFATYDKASAAVLNDPHDLTIGPDGRLYIADKFGDRIVIMDPETLEILQIVAEGQLPNVHDISFGPDGRAVVAVSGASAVAFFDLGADGEMTFTAALQPFPGTEGALAHSNGDLYVMASATGELMRIAGEELVGSVPGMPGAHDVAEAPDGTIWVADNFQQRLVRFSEELEQLQVIQGPGYGFRGPRYLDVDPAGRLVVADQDAHRILMIDPLDGAVLGILGDGLPGEGPYKFDDPEGVAIDGNRFFFADSDNNRIVKYVVVMN